MPAAALRSDSRHGADGMAGHVPFGARTRDAVVILGGILLVLALFFSGSVELLLELVSAAILGLILFFTVPSWRSAAAP